MNKVIQVKFEKESKICIEKDMTIVVSQLKIRYSLNSYLSPPHRGWQIIEKKTSLKIFLKCVEEHKYN